MNVEFLMLCKLTEKGIGRMLIKFFVVKKNVK